MLKISIDKIKKNDREIFYGKNDYSAPKRGTQKMVIVTYENLYSGYYGIKKSKRKENTTQITMWDRSNAYNTFYHDVAIRNLELGGTARQILCNAIG